MILKSVSGFNFFRTAKIYIESIEAKADSSMKRYVA